MSLATPADLASSRTQKSVENRRPTLIVVVGIPTEAQERSELSLACANTMQVPTPAPYRDTRRIPGGLPTVLSDVLIVAMPHGSSIAEIEPRRSAIGLRPALLLDRRRFVTCSARHLFCYGSQALQAAST